MAMLAEESANRAVVQRTIDRLNARVESRVSEPERAEGSDT